VKALLAAALAAVSLALAPAAHATPNDDMFYAAIDHSGIPISHREAWVEANAACTFLGEGHSVGALMVNLMHDCQRQLNFDQLSARWFLGAIATLL
jgi:hypothetical protein